MSESAMLIASYEDVVKAQKDGNITIIDVREDNEIAKTGKLPGSIHIPKGDIEKVLTTLSPEEFQQKYEKSKPTNLSIIYVSCASGKRSTMVQNELQKLGYTRVYNYTGGWTDWEKHQVKQ